MLFSPSPRRKRLQLRLSERRLLLMLGDAFAVIISAFLALYIWTIVAGYDYTLEFILLQSYWFPILLLLWFLLANANDYYDLPVAADRVQSMQRLGIITLQLIVVYLLVFFFSPRTALPRLFIFYYGVAAFVFVGLWRIASPALIGWASSARRVLIIGADESAEIIVRALGENGKHAYEIRGIIGPARDIGKVIGGIPVIGTGSDLLNFVNRDRVSELIITNIPEMGDEIFRAIMQAYERGVSLVPMPLLYERITGRIPVRHVKNNWALVLPISGQSIFNPYQPLQRIMDITLSLIGVVLMLLMIIPLALLVRLDSSGPLFYRQQRVGLNGRLFYIIKFRTMIPNAEDKTGAVFSHPGDQRITRVGRFLRKTRLDELPQLINVLRGDMSIVGPRPERPEHIDRLTEKIPFYRTRLVIRPGLTGWAQVRYSYGSDDDDALIKLEYDLYYIRNQSLALDLNIIIRTIGKVLRMAGA
jgi:exopolysaccharide biosynthesis polyprenyl glycosylphosphotransferase